MISNVAGWWPSTCMALHVVEIEMLGQTLQRGGHHGAGLDIAQMQHPKA